MPCDGGYMMPTQEEINRLGSKVEDLKSVADAIVLHADVMREIILEGKGHLSGLLSGQVAELAQRFDQSWSLINLGNKLRAKIKGEYAYGSTGDAAKLIVGYEEAVANLMPAYHAVQKMLDDEVISGDEYRALENDQIEHRMIDVQRLLSVFTDKRDFKTVALLAQVDFTKPLQPQLGFNPDDY